MKDKFLAEMGSRLAKRRKFLDLTQEEAAELADVSIQMISYAERGEKALRPDNIVKLCTAYKISADYLLTGAVTEWDIIYLDKRLANLNAECLHHLEGIIDHFLRACNDAQKLGEKTD